LGQAQMPVVRSFQNSQVWVLIPRQVGLVELQNFQAHLGSKRSFVALEPPHRDLLGDRQDFVTFDFQMIFLDARCQGPQLWDGSQTTVSSGDDSALELEVEVPLVVAGGVGDSADHLAGLIALSPIGSAKQVQCLLVRKGILYILNDEDELWGF